MQFSTLLIYLAIRTKKRKQIFILNSFSLLESFQNAVRAHIQQSNTAMEWSHCFRTAQAACANFSKCLTETEVINPVMAQVITRVPGRTFCYCDTELQAPGLWQVMFSTHVKDFLIKKIVQLRDHLNFLQHFWCLRFLMKQTWAGA